MHGSIPGHERFFEQICKTSAYVTVHIHIRVYIYIYTYIYIYMYISINIVYS